MKRFTKSGTLHGLLAVIAAAALCAACSHEDTRPGEEAFVGDRTVTLWSSLAQVRQQVATVHYGDRVEIVEKQNDQAKVRTAVGLVGWTPQATLMDSALWHRARSLAESAAAMPVQARATAERVTNVHIEPGRTTPRTYQLRGNTPVDVLGRAVADFTKGGTDEGAAPETRKEDWSLVRAKDEAGGTVAGWVLRRFVKFDIPPELADYSSQFRFVAWFELSRVPTGEAEPAPAKAAPAGAAHGKVREAPGPPDAVREAAEAAAPADKPQFLVAGIQGADGQPCDFTIIRAYTWGAARQRYETAYVESNLCGSLPIHAQAASPPGGNAAFSFKNEGRGGEEQREYAMHQTSVRRVDNVRHPAGAHAPRKGR